MNQTGYTVHKMQCSEVYPTTATSIWVCTDCGRKVCVQTQGDGFRFMVLFEGNPSPLVVHAAGIIETPEQEPVVLPADVEDFLSKLLNRHKPVYPPDDYSSEDKGGSNENI